MKQDIQITMAWKINLENVFGRFKKQMSIYHLSLKGNKIEGTCHSKYSVYKCFYLALFSLNSQIEM